MHFPWFLMRTLAREQLVTRTVLDLGQDLRPAARAQEARPQGRVPRLSSPREAALPAQQRQGLCVRVAASLGLRGALLLLLLSRFIGPDSVRPHRRHVTRLPVPGILQARALEWVAISFSNAGK